MHTLVRKKFYEFVANDIGISEQVVSVASGVWELGRKPMTSGRAKVFFVESGVNDAELRLLLTTERFRVICVLHHGGIPVPPKIEDKVIIYARVEVVDGRMATDAFVDLEAVSLPHSEAIVDLSKQMEYGFDSLRKQTIEDAISANEMRKELEDISGRADNFMTQLVAGFGADKAMADLFMRLLAVGKDGKPLSYAMVGAQMGVTKQAVEAKFRKMEKKFPAAHRHLKAIRAREKTTQFSAISPTERRREGVDSAYDYDAD